MNKRFARLSLTTLTVLALSLFLVIGASAAVWTDKGDYSPGSVVTISGDNSDGAGFATGETVHVDVSGPNGYTASCDGTVDDNGAWLCQVTLAGDGSAIGDYSYTAISDSGVTESGIFTDGVSTIGYTGQGIDGWPSNQTCNTTDSDLLTPIPAGDKGYLFVLNQITGDGTLWRMDVTFSLSGTQTGLVPVQTLTSGGKDTTKWAVYAPIGDTLVSATAYALSGGGTTTGQYVVSHCATGASTAKDLTVIKTATPSFTRTYTWGISKSVDQSEIDTSGSATFNYTVSVTHDSGTDSAWAVNGTITVHNPNTFDVAGVNVTDMLLGGTCNVANGTGLTVLANSDATASYTCTFGSNPGSGTNTATATWDQATYGTPSGSASGSATFDFSTATPTIVDGTVTVTDTLGGTLGTVSYTDSSPKTFTYPYTFSGDPAGTCTKHDNTATFTTNTSGSTGSASQTVTVCVGADLSVSKTATPAFKRTYNWNISKTVDKTLVEQVGGTATFNYTVKVWGTGYTDSNWAITGTITVTNPNDWEDVDVALSDSIPGCILARQLVTVPAGQSEDIGYSCDLSSGDSGTNTATATWDAVAYHTANGSAEGPASYEFTTPTTEVNKTVNVQDNFNGTVVTLGTVSYPGPQEFTYSHTVAVPTWNCVTYNNTATIVETGQTANASVKVCGPAKTGALTMGFWQNKNGQGIISGQAKTGVCPSAAWLRQYAPFQDLSATSTCSQVATYVYNVIKAANASGASMNAMLKAQMLATSLDVYFSDPALGGNKINAPAPIGGVSIDLTMICKMIDGTGGTATCSGTYQDVSSAFGGSPKTVLQMLAYAASQSNVGGTAWYGQVKATQELAKNAFDAINNQVAFAP